jgi:hypothetical protein
LQRKIIKWLDSIFHLSALLTNHLWTLVS